MSETENGYRDSRKLTRWVRYMLRVQIAVAILSIGSNFLEYQLLTAYQDGSYSSQEEAVADGEASDLRQQALGIIHLIIYIILGVLILRWIHRANYNARQLGAEGMEFTPGWAIGYYFIPILTLWKPYQAMKEIWKASHNPNDWYLEKTSPILAIWWFLWIFNNILGQATFRINLHAEELHKLMRLNISSQIGEVLSILLALATFYMITSIFLAQNATYNNACRISQQESASDASV